MPGLPPGYSLIALDTTDSTNLEVRRRVEQGLADKSVIWAGLQTAGRGRRGRDWVSPSGNLFVSIYLVPRVPLAEAAQLSFVAGLAVRDCVAGLSGKSNFALKWPNDVLADGAKISGILLEAVSGTSSGDGLIIGIGVNLASHPTDTPYPACDLQQMTGVAIAPETALQALLRAFEKWRQAWAAEGFEVIRAEWMANAYNVGRTIRIERDGGSLEGIFRGIDDTGALLIETGDNQTMVIQAGDVYFPDRSGR